MKVLVLGGSRFVGWHITQALHSRGHEVSVFNRGKSNTDLPDGVEQLRGDRNTDREALKTRQWDAVVDVNAYLPRQVQEMVEELKNRVEHYVFISTISVYADSFPPLTEESPLIELPDPTVEEVTGATYGGLKVLCEKTLIEQWGEKHTILRPGLVVGARDLTYRFPFWIKRALEGGELLAPNKPINPVQFVHAADIADFTVKTIEEQVYGTFNMVREPELWGEVLREVVRQTDTGATLTWVDSHFLLEHEVQPWADLPAWLPDTPEFAGMVNVSNKKAELHGFRSRSLEEVVSDTLAWVKTQPDEAFTAGMSRERMQELLQLWHHH